MNLSKQEFLSTNSSKYIQDKRKLREELDAEMVKFLERGGVVQDLPKAYSGEFNKAKSGLIQIDSVIAGSIAEARSNMPKPKKPRSARDKAYYDKQKGNREIKKQKAQGLREALRLEQKEVFLAWSQKTVQGDMKLLARASGVSHTAIRSAFCGLTVLKAENWAIVKKHIQEFDFTVNQGKPNKRKPKHENDNERRAKRLNYLCKYQQERRLSAITQKYCGGATV